MSGEGAKVPSRCSEKNPQERNLKRGSSEHLKTSLQVLATDRQSEQDPEGEALPSSANDKRVRLAERQPGWLTGKTPEVESWTWLWDEISSQKFVEEKTAESSRKAEGGT
jgi:hypothetical protein